MEDFLKYTGWLIALISVIVNILQLIQNSKLKKKINQSVGDNSTATQQAHTGHGDNLNIGGDYTKK